MKTLFFFKNMQPAEEEKLRDYFAAKQPQLEKLLSRFSDDEVTMNIRTEKFNKHSAYEVELTMSMRGKTFSAKEASHMITKAVDWAKDRLVMQLKKSLLHMRRGHRSIRAENKLRLRISAPLAGK